MSDEEESSSDEKRTCIGVIEACLCVRCKNFLRRPIMLIERVGNVCSSCLNAIKGIGRSPTIIFPTAGSSSGHQTGDDSIAIIYEPSGMPPPQRARVDRNIEHGNQDPREPCPYGCKCFVCMRERAELSSITERNTSSEEDRSALNSIQFQAEVHQVNDPDEASDIISPEEEETSPEPPRFEEVVDITDSVGTETTEPAATVYSDDRHDPPVTDRRLAPQDSSSSNETSEPTETTTVGTPENPPHVQRSQQIEVLPVEASTEQRNPEAEDVVDAARIVYATEHSLPVTEDSPHKKTEDSEEPVHEDDFPNQMSAEPLGRDVPEGPVGPSVSKSDESDDSVLRRRSDILKEVSEHTATKPTSQRSVSAKEKDEFRTARDETSLDVDPEREDEREKSQSSSINKGKVTTVKKFGTDDKASEEQGSSKMKEQKSASEQEKRDSKTYDKEQSMTEEEKDKSVVDEDSEEEEESSDSEELRDEPDIPCEQKGEKFESKEGDGGSSADDLLEEESEEENCDDNDDKSSKTKEDVSESHSKESTTEEKGIGMDETVSTKESKSSMEITEVEDSLKGDISEDEESDDEGECKDQEASTSQAERCVEKGKPKDSKSEYRPLKEEDTSEGEESDDVEDCRKKGKKREQGSKGEPRNVRSTKEEQECTEEKSTRYDRLTESETDDEESNDNIKKAIGGEKEAEKIAAKEEGGSSRDKFFEAKSSECERSESDGKVEDMSKTLAQQGGKMTEKENSTPETEDENSRNAKCSKQKAGDKDQQESSTSRDKEQLLCKKSAGEIKNLKEKEEKSDVTEAKDTVLMILERDTLPREPAKMEIVQTLYGIENVALAQIMEGLRFQCKNHIQGCKETFSPEEMIAHQESCLFQTVHCEFEDCIWTGTLKKYTRHFLRHTDLKKLQSVDDRFHLPSWNTQNSTCILQTSGGSFILSTRIVENKLYYLIYDLRRTVGNVKFDLFLEYYGKSGARFKIRCNITRSAKLKCFDERKATAIDLNSLNLFIPLKDNPRMSIYVESDDFCFHMRTTSINLLKCKKCGLYMDSPIKQCMHGHYVCGRCYQNVKECPECDASLVIVEALNNWKDDARYICKFNSGKKVDLNVTTYHESFLCTFHPWTCPECPEYELKPLFDYFELIDHMQCCHRIPVLPNSGSITRLGRLSYEIYFIQFSKLFLFKSVYLKETDTSEYYVIYIGPKQDRYRYEIQIKYKTGFYTKYMSLSCECAYNKSNEILRKKAQEPERISPDSAMSPAEVIVSPESTDKLSNEAEEATKRSTEKVPQKNANEVTQSQSSTTTRRSSVPQISSTQKSTSKSRIKAYNIYSRAVQTPTTTRLPYSRTFSAVKIDKQTSNQKIASRSPQEIQRRSIGSTVQESPEPKPTNTPVAEKSPLITPAAIPEKISPKLPAQIKTKSLAVKGKGETDEEKLTPDEGIVIRNGLERFGERFEFAVKIRKITERNSS